MGCLKYYQFFRGGRLPVTWYPKDFIKIPMTDMRMRSDPSSGYPGRTYKFYQGKKVYEFGYGLSYSNYSYKFVTVCEKLGNILVSKIGSESCERAKFLVIVSVKNEGRMAGKHPVLLFLRRDEVVKGSPVKQLVGFQTVKLNADEKANVEFEINPCEQFSRASEDGTMVIDYSGLQYLVVGDQEYPMLSTQIESNSLIIT
ncbi:hypothetical protein MIMGU_mgv1a021944mg [Erythranthe guttata]|uniref:Fibronectin type III-like domain-containing protein n=1 Tax=Erythranthe guttata TaxID=4155 RepID=A0A022Q6H1_ERYGU|nr:hypothetical protein MIMGU_mgv1a021944mg [Erythranthe guttata]